MIPLRRIADGWSKNYRHHGGLRAVARCLGGSLAVRAGLVRAPPLAPAGLEALSFSVVPWMSALWARLLGATARPDRVWIGDCSGGFGRRQRAHLPPSVRVVPVLNALHGKKLDLFLRQVCRAETVLISDDDIFWTSREPLDWALAELAARPRAVVVSLRPREHVATFLRDQLPRPMGSFCLVVRRRQWLEEGLSFAPLGHEDRAAGAWFYDTGDRAHQVLLERGWEVVLAPPEIVDQLVAFDGVSTWTLKLQKHPPHRLGQVADIPVRRAKALSAVWLARGFSRLVTELGWAAPEDAQILPPERLDEAEGVLASSLPEAQREALRAIILAQLERLESGLRQHSGQRSGQHSA